MELSEWLTQNHPKKLGIKFKWMSLLSEEATSMDNNAKAKNAPLSGTGSE
jgi:hypothetical protein